MKCKFSKTKWNEFVDKIFNMGVYKWKKKYYNNDICDGEQWSLEIEFYGIQKFESFGSNEYPDNWEDFIEIIQEYFPQMR
jgi:hypothetical protein